MSLPGLSVVLLLTLGWFASISWLLLLENAAGRLVWPDIQNLSVKASIYTLLLVVAIMTCVSGFTRSSSHHVEDKGST